MHPRAESISLVNMLRERPSLPVFAAIFGVVLALVALVVPVTSPLGRITLLASRPAETIGCLRLTYPGVADEPIPKTVILSERVAHRSEALFVAINPAKPRRSAAQPMGWRWVGDDSLDIVYYHYPIIRLPRRGPVRVGRVSTDEPMPLFWLLFGNPDFPITAAPIQC